MGKWQSNSFTLCGAHYLQKSDCSVQIDQRELTRKLFNADFQVPKNLNRLNGRNKFDATGLKTLRGVNGSLQWLVSNTRVDLAAKVSLSASETSNPTVGSLQRRTSSFDKPNVMTHYPFISIQFRWII